MTEDKESVINPMQTLATKIDPKTAQAIDAIYTGKIPPSAIKSHPGRGNKTFRYISHIWATRTLNAAFGMLWDWEVLDYQLFPDKSSVVRGKLTIHVQISDNPPEFYDRVIAEIGSFQFPGDNTNTILANIIAGAASRCLARCMLRAFNLGSEFYEEDEELSPEQVWKLVQATITKAGLNQADVIAAFKKAGISKETLTTRYEEAMKIIFALKNPLPTDL